MEGYSPTHFPFEVLALIVKLSDTGMYFTYTQVNMTFRRLVYENIPSPPSGAAGTISREDQVAYRKVVPETLAMHLLYHQSAESDKDDRTKLFAPRFKLAEYNPEARDGHYIKQLTNSWNLRSSGNEDVDTIRRLRWQRKRAEMEELKAALRKLQASMKKKMRKMLARIKREEKEKKNQSRNKNQNRSTNQKHNNNNNKRNKNNNNNRNENRNKINKNKSKKKGVRKV